MGVVTDTGVRGSLRCGCAALCGIMASVWGHCYSSASVLFSTSLTVDLLKSCWRLDSISVRSGFLLLGFRRTCAFAPNDLKQVSYSTITLIKMFVFPRNCYSISPHLLVHLIAPTKSLPVLKPSTGSDLFLISVHISREVLF